MSDLDALKLIKAREALEKLGSYRRNMTVELGNNDLRTAILDAALLVLRRDIEKLEGI
jgi:hypothetical protein